MGAAGVDLGEMEDVPVETAVEAQKVAATTVEEAAAEAPAEEEDAGDSKEVAAN